MFNDYQHLEYFKLTTREQLRKAKRTRNNNKPTNRRKPKKR